MNEKAIGYQQIMQQVEIYANQGYTLGMEQGFHKLRANQYTVPINELNDLVSKVKELMCLGHKNAAKNSRNDAKKHKKIPLNALSNAELYLAECNDKIAEAISKILVTNLDELIDQYRKLKIEFL